MDDTTRQHPHVMYGSHVDMQYFSQTPHFDRFVVEDGLQELGSDLLLLVQLRYVHKKEYDFRGMFIGVIKHMYCGVENN